MADWALADCLRSDWLRFKWLRCGRLSFVYCLRSDWLRFDWLFEVWLSVWCFTDYLRSDWLRFDWLRSDWLSFYWLFDVWLIVWGMSDCLRSEGMFELYISQRPSENSLTALGNEFGRILGKQTDCFGQTVQTQLYPTFPQKKTDSLIHAIS